MDLALFLLTWCLIGIVAANLTGVLLIWDAKGKFDVSTLIACSIAGCIAGPAGLFFLVVSLATVSVSWLGSYSGRVLFDFSDRK